MSILGVVVRCRPEDVQRVADQLSEMPGVEVGLNPGDGRLVVVMEDSPVHTAAQAMANVALWTLVLNVSLVYEYSGADIGDADTAHTDHTRFQSWRTSLTQMAAGIDAAQAPASTPPVSRLQ